jgi:hypothetical protein
LEKATSQQVPSPQFPFWRITGVHDGQPFDAPFPPE